MESTKRRSRTALAIAASALGVAGLPGSVCTNCGADYPDDAPVCPNCGVK